MTEPSPTSTKRYVLPAHQRIRNMVTATLVAVFVTLTFGLATLSAAHAASGTWQSGKGGLVDGRLIASVDATGDLATIPAGLELKIKPGWKTYWRAPGDAGLPPRLDWSASKNTTGATLGYPTPKRFQLFGLQTFGYGDQVVFPIRLSVATPGEAVTLNATVEVLVCEKTCVPQTLNLALDLPAGTATPDAPVAQLINRFQNLVPAKGPTPGLKIDSAIAVTHDGRPALEIEASSQLPFKKPDVFAEFDPHVAFMAPRISLSSDKRRATLTLVAADDLPTGRTLSGETVVLTLADSQEAIEQSQTIAAGAPTSTLSNLSLQLKYIVFALIGGFILNLMPCVLPVLSIKLLSFANHRNATPARIRKSFLATAAGVISSMLILACALIALQSSGQSIGWGIQFQQPVFIVAMATIVTLFACNLFGFYEIVLPARVSNWAGQASNAEHGVVGEFSAGALATLLATPCSAPFIGTAVGFALAGGTVEILTIFASLGVGLALPYIAVAIHPGLVRVMPKPGQWMMTLRVVLGLALAATAVWLLYVLAGQVSTTSLLVIAALLILLTASLAFRQSIAALFSQTAAIGLAFAICVATVATSFALQQQVAERTTAQFADRITWQKFDRDKIKSLVSQGKTVFVDVTADWCITCKTNKSLAIDTKSVADRLATDVIAMRADWTLPDEAIAKFLAGYGRFGIPFNIVYGPRKPAGVVMPELLTPAIVTRAIDEAGGARKAETPPTNDTKG